MGDIGVEGPVTGLQQFWEVLQLLRGVAYWREVRHWRCALEDLTCAPSYLYLFPRYCEVTSAMESLQ